jgi:hypothetical protein
MTRRHGERLVVLFQEDLFELFQVLFDAEKSIMELLIVGCNLGLESLEACLKTSELEPESNRAD